MTNFNPRFIRALMREPVDRTPVWIMRQAGRYLPEYRALRAKTPNFLTFCKTPELACEATLQPLRRFPLDAAIVFSDILTVVDAMGADLEFVESKGPVIQAPIRNARDLDRLHYPDVNQSLGYVFKAIQYISRELAGRTPLIGFAGSPWTVATYFIEGGTSKAFRHIKKMQFEDPQLLKKLLEKITAVTIEYVNGQIEAGAEVIMIFDSWGGLLSAADYETFSLHYLARIAQSCIRQKDKRKIPFIAYTKNKTCLHRFADIQYDAVGVDWTIDLSTARSMVQDRIALQGNMDPFTLFAEPDYIRNAVKNVMQQYGSGSGHIFNLGHGIDQDTPIHSVEVMMEAIHEYGKKTSPIV